MMSLTEPDQTQQRPRGQLKLLAVIGVVLVVLLQDRLTALRELLVRSLKRGDPFTRANSRRLLGIAALVGLGAAEVVGLILPGSPRALQVTLRTHF